MKLTLSALALVLAAPTIAQFDIQSAPFNLVLVSDNKTINGDTLSSCHEGAAIESLCLSHSITESQTEAIPAGVYYLNTSSSEVVPNATLGTPGYLTWTLQGSNFNESEPLTLYISPTTNVALPLFEPAEGTLVSFDENNLLNIQNYVDDTVNPPIAGDYKAYYRWYACLTYYSGYTYQTLSWVLGSGAPENPSCVKVDVKRVFI